jgi:hypothetical protein
MQITAHLARPLTTAIAESKSSHYLRPPLRAPPP